MNEDEVRELAGKLHQAEIDHRKLGEPRANPDIYKYYALARVALEFCEDLNDLRIIEDRKNEPDIPYEEPK